MPQSDPTPDTRATVELCEQAHATMTPGPWYSDQDYRVYGPVPADFDRTRDTAPCIFETKHFEGTGRDSDGCAALRNALPDIIRDLRRLAEVEAENVRLRTAAELVMGDPANVKMRDKLRAALTHREGQ